MQRLYFVQWLRVFLIGLVVAHHAGQAYGPTGGSWPIRDPEQAEWLGPFFGVNAAFFMGFFFLIAGYFTGPSFDRKGAGAFVRDRLIRLGIPLVFFTFFVFGPLVYFWTSPPESFVSFFVFDYVGNWHIEMGHLWFVAQLLAYGLIYAAWRVWVRRNAERGFPPPGDLQVLTYVVALALAGALVRQIYPQDEWVDILWLVPAEPAHLPQYVSLFVIGVVAGRGDWFNRVSSGLGARWFALAVLAFGFAGWARGNEDALPVSFWTVWGVAEAFICVGMILGLTVLFRRFANRPGVWADRLDANVYGVYLIHWFVVIALQAAIDGVALGPTAKFLIVTALALIASFAISAAVRQIPAVRRVV